MDQPRHPSPARNTADIPESTSDDHLNRAKRPPPNASTAPGRPRIDQHRPPRSKHRHAEVALRGTRPHDPESDLPAALPGDHQSPPPHRRHPDRTHPHPPTPDTPGLPTTPTPDKQRTPSDTKPFTHLSPPHNITITITTMPLHTGLDSLSDPGKDLRQHRGHPAHRCTPCAA
jgi:hypothetical protein